MRSVRRTTLACGEFNYTLWPGIAIAPSSMAQLLSEASLLRRLNQAISHAVDMALLDPSMKDCSSAIDNCLLTV